jgi:hypothetical protein
MFRWMIVIFLALVVISLVAPWLQKIGWGKLPGDFRFKLFGRDWFLPFTSTVIFSLIAAGIARLI